MGKLGKILDAFDDNQKKSQEVAARIKSEHETFLEGFTKIAKTIIRPAMEALLAELKERGHDGRIEEEAENRERDGKTRNAYIALNIYPKGKRSSQPHDTPRISFWADSHKPEISVHECTMMPGRGGSSGSYGKYTLDQITAEIVEQHVVKVLAQAMGK